MKKKISILLLTAALLCVGAVPAFADNFTPSVTQKEAPTIVPMKEADGKEVAAIIYDKDNNEIRGISADEITVTPLSEREKASETVKESLDKAYADIEGAKSLKDLCPEVVTTLSGITDEVKVEDLVVRDLFDVEIPEEDEELLQQAGNHLTLKFDLGIEQDALLMAMVNCDGTKWEMVDQKGIVINSDGTVTVTFDKFCPVAFITDGSAVSIDPNGPSSPQTSDISFWPAAGVALIAVICGLILVYRKNKKAGI